MKVTPQSPREDHGWFTRGYLLAPEAAGTDPFRLEISVPGANRSLLSDRLEAPALAAVFPAMALGEPIRLEGPLAASFHYNLREIMKYFALWNPGTLRPVEVQCDGTDAPPPAPSGVAACFSGGVDSWYTLQHHRAASEPVDSRRLTHGLFVHGFDLGLDKVGLYDRLADTYEDLLARDGIRLLRLRTNLRAGVDRHVRWMTSHGAAIGMAGHALAPAFHTLVVPSTNRYSLINPPIGSNPITDPSLGADHLRVLHHGSEASRIQKILSVAGEPGARDHLRVCFQDTPDGRNCGVCRKCAKVLLPLWITGRLDAFTCFPPGFDPATVPAEVFAPFNPTHYPAERSYADELRDLARVERPDALCHLPGDAAGDVQPPSRRRWFFSRRQVFPLRRRFREVP